MSKAQVKSATRVLEVLEYFKLGQQARSMSELASDLGYPQSSTTVLLKTLVTLGYLNFDRRERVYFPTPKVTALGDWVPKALFGSGKAVDALNDVHAATGEGVFLAVKNDVYMQYLKTKESIHALRFHIDEGTMRPLTRSAAGWVLLSTLPADKVDNIVRRANIATSHPAERLKVKEVQEKIDQVRQRGFAWAENIPLEGGATLAVLLPTTVQGQPVALALGGVADRFKKNSEKYLLTLKAAARSVRDTDDFDLPIEIEL
ncbi:putative transcriptional regulator [Pseudooceanicola batsensis HTCC2597]|uniref:Putative transcriptional regulator n=1 Tax=Pseudooceanicola batsensis (strain ATCC BAA-863 / DSM 15984 / KCTC 12145 / HTCC2597) TaxID=252305 RepID=A3U143_PSEBH|nr:helix-turn-helix domain-containing protein [Pseudooceanicola batsensis]EAQ02026.1 putative transcriptional regulator [Pseudooceanicola batsensis HTCC2597]